MSQQLVEYAHRLDSVAGETQDKPSPTRFWGSQDFRSSRTTAMRQVFFLGTASSV
jgi:hypothetical protein